MQGRWPLHPKPYEHESLGEYVHRLAEAYGVSYQSFCLHALGISRADGEARLFYDPSLEILSRLSEGTGFSVDQLEQMGLFKTYKRLMRDISEHIASQLNCQI